MKRFTETTKWQDEWFQELEQHHKLFWSYICDNCDCAGVWKANLKLASFQVGHPLSAKELLAAFEKRIEDLGNGKWWIVSFISFQYGTLSDACAPHRRVMQVIANHGLEQRVGLPLRNGSHRVA
jgi:hypothetical protein